MDGACQATQSSDPYGTWDNVVQVFVKIITRNLEILIKYSINRVILPSRAKCRATVGECKTGWQSIGLQCPWTLVNSDGTTSSIKKGPTHTTKRARGITQVYTVTTKETTFALTRTTEKNLCRYKIIQTEHPQVLHLWNSTRKNFQEPIEDIDLQLRHLFLRQLEIYLCGKAFEDSVNSIIQRHHGTEMCPETTDPSTRPLPCEHRIWWDSL